MSLRDMSINKKIITTFLALMSVCLCASAVVYWQGVRSSAASDGLVTAQSIGGAVSAATEAQLEQALYHRGFLMGGGSDMQTLSQGKRSDVVAAIETAEKLARNQRAIAASLSELRAAADAFQTMVVEPQAKAHAAGDDGAAIGRAERSPQLAQFRAAAVKVRAEAAALTKSMVEQQRNAHDALLWTLIIAALWPVPLPLC